MAELRPILLVEDSLKDIELVLAALKKNNFANEVVVARDGAEALDYLYRRGKFQSQAGGLPIVMLLDLKMPKMDGLEVLRQIKGDEALKLKPVGFQQFVDAIKQTGMFWAVINEPPPVGPAD